MDVRATTIEGCFEIISDVRGDDRGWFARAFSGPDLLAMGIEFHVQHANVAFTATAGTARGLHYQVAPHGETKLFRCVSGAVFDVAVDLREGSESFGAWFGTELTPANGKALLVPKGCAHGYMALEDQTVVVYFADEIYVPDAERVLSIAHQGVGVSWPIEVTSLSPKDATADPRAVLEGSGYRT